MKIIGEMTEFVEKKEDGGRRFLREANVNLNSQLVKIIKDMLQRGIDLKDIQVKVQGSNGKLYSKLTGCMVGWPLDSKKNCCLFYSNGPGKEMTLDELLNKIKEESVKKNINRISQLIFWAYHVSEDPMSPNEDGPAKHISKVINNGKELIFVKAGSKKIKSDYDAFLAEYDSDPEQMMKEFVEKKENDAVEYPLRESLICRAKKLIGG